MVCINLIWLFQNNRGYYLDLVNINMCRTCEGTPPMVTVCMDHTNSSFHTLYTYVNGIRKSVYTSLPALIRFSHRDNKNIARDENKLIVR